MKALILTLSLIYGIGGNAQYKFKLKEHIAPASCMLVAGIFEGVQDRLAFHNTSNNYFWGQDSWQNKYIDRDPSKPKTFRGKYLVFTTDGWHMMKFSRNLFTSGAIVFHITKGKRKWFIYIIEGLSYWAINRIGFTIVYNSF